MSTSKELKEQAEELMRKAEELRRQELANVVGEIKRVMAEHGLTAEDIGLGQSQKPQAARKAATSKAKYRDPNTGATWTGKGRLPAWALAYRASGHDIAELAIQ